MVEKHGRGRLIKGGFEGYGTMEQLEKALLYQEVKEINKHEIILKNGVRITIECSEWDCCAGGSGLFEYDKNNPPIDAVITDFKIHDPSRIPNDDTFVMENTITLFHNRNPIINANATTDAGNGGYYYSITSLVVDGIHFPFVEA